MLDLLLKRRSTRKFKARPVEKEKVQKIIQACLTAPSGKNLKPCDLVLVEEKSSLEKLGDARGKFSQLIKSAPLALVIVADPKLSTTWMSDGSIIGIIAQLMAEDLGLRSCWVHVESRTHDNGTNVEENVAEILGIPKDKKILSIIALGYGDENKAPHEIAKLDYSKIHYEKY